MYVESVFWNYPYKNTRKAMNEINSSKRLKFAIAERAEGDKILQVCYWIWLVMIAWTGTVNNKCKLTHTLTHFCVWRSNLPKPRRKPSILVALVWRNKGRPSLMDYGRVLSTFQITSKVLRRRRSWTCCFWHNTSIWFEMSDPQIIVGPRLYPVVKH